MTDDELRDLRVHPSKLCLDPRNPRLESTLHEQRSLAEVDIVSDDVQRRVLSDILKREHQVESVIQSIENSGYLNIDAIFVRRCGSQDKFLVLEGNRRTAAIKSLLPRLASLSDHVRRTLAEIPVKELVCRDREAGNEIVSRILAIRHINGPKEWSPMLRAFQVFQEYQQEFSRSLPRAITLQYIPRIADVVGARLIIKRADVRTALIIARLFTQLRDAGFQMRSDHYSLLEMTVAKPRLLVEYFEMDEDRLKVSDVGLERINELMIEDDAPVKNPSDHRSFYHVFLGGTEQDVLSVARGTVSPKDAKAKVERRNQIYAFRQTLQDIKERLEELRPADFQGVHEELRLIQSIQELVNNRLVPLARSARR